MHRNCGFKYEYLSYTLVGFLLFVGPLFVFVTVFWTIFLNGIYTDIIFSIKYKVFNPVQCTIHNMLNETFKVYMFVLSVELISNFVKNFKHTDVF